MQAHLKCLVASLAVLGLCLSLNAADKASKPIDFEPVFAAAPHGNAALFVGINRFTKDSGLNPLKYAVDDAIAQAHLFVSELKLISATNCWISLSGDPSNVVIKEQLAQLKAEGVICGDGNKDTVLDALSRVVSLSSGPGDLVLISFSSHGFENEKPYVMLADGRERLLAETGLSIKTIEEEMASSQAGKRLLLIDACRSQPHRGNKGGFSGFQKALEAAEGQVVLASCDAGQVSLEPDVLEHGVFTYFLLQALRGKAASDVRGYITLGTASAYIAESVEAWGRRNVTGDVSRIQKPFHKGPKAADTIPLAVNPVIRQQVGEFKKVAEIAIEALKPKIGTRGGFSSAHLVSLSEALEHAKDDQDGRELLSNAQAFANGTIHDDVFVPYLEHVLKPQSTPVLSLPPAEVVSYLSSGSGVVGNKKDYREFSNRFEKKAENEIRDRMLMKTWFVLPGIKSWEDAKAEAKKINARLPKLEEMKTLITLTPQKGDMASEVYLDIRFFPKLDRTTRCWTADSVMFKMSQIQYIDYSVPAFRNTSKSEMLVVMLIRDD